MKMGYLRVANFMALPPWLLISCAESLLRPLSSTLLTLSARTFEKSVGFTPIALGSVRVRISLFESGLEGAREIRRRKDAAVNLLWSVDPALGLRLLFVNRGISRSGRVIVILQRGYKIPAVFKKQPGSRTPASPTKEVKTARETHITVANCHVAYALFRLFGSPADRSKIPKALRCWRMPAVCRCRYALQGRPLLDRLPHSADKFGQCSYPRPTLSREPAP